MVKWFLLHEWKAKIRSPFWQKSLGINIVLGLLAAYLALNMLALGYFLDVILLEAFPERPPLEIFNQYLIYYLLIDLLMRFFLQQYPILDLQRYLLLPVKKGKLFHFLLLKSIPGFFNILPLFFIVPFAAKVVFTGQSTLTAMTWLLAVFSLVLINNFVAYYLKKKFSLQPLLSAGIIAAIAGLAYLDFRGLIPLSAYFGTGMETVLRRPALLIVPLLALGSVYAFLYSVFQHYAYLDVQVSDQRRVTQTGRHLEVFDRLGKIGQLIQLDIHLIRRNKRPRTMFLMAIVFLIYPFIFMDMLDQTGWMIFVGIIVTGMTMANYGQFLLSWESSFFDLLMGRNFSMREYFEAKFFLFAGMVTFFTLVSMLYGFLNARLPLIFFAVALYNIGVNSFITMFFSTYNSKRIDPDRQAFFNYEGVGASQFLYVIPLFLGPVLIYLPFGVFGYLYPGLAAIALCGLVGILFKNQLLDALVRQFQSRKYIISGGFKQAA